MTSDSRVADDGPRRPTARGGGRLAPTVTRDEVRAAILWAIDHDVASLVRHRRIAHTVHDEGRRRRSDADLVARWRRAAQPALDAVRTPAP
ncbi:hypothetical protein [Xylanimonas ulmi]|uniref:hypothetical protein n=1 Tax=Xylanimonas ulmi TaxID=228973 RepID=UPI00102AC29F|nr:hypothetical protein [Xylanibacterium ulmi]